MDFELKPGESVRRAIRRIVRKELEKALELLGGDRHGSRDEAVHEARKSFKKVRAVLRMVRPAIGESNYRAENICFRDAARPLTKVRDAKILVETLDHLLEHFREHVAGRSFERTREAHQANLRELRREILDEQNALAGAAATVSLALERVKDWADVPNKWRSLGDGLKNVYRRARGAFREVTNSPTVENLHELRKQAKYLRYQLEILRPLWPERLEELADEADRMTELLGDDHDAAVFRQMLTDDPDRFGDAGDIEMLVALIDRRRVELQHEALVLGERFFQDAPREFARRLKGYCNSFRALADRPADPRLAAT
jgi:CHAD domain-containing protein